MNMREAQAHAKSRTPIIYNGSAYSLIASVGIRYFPPLIAGQVTVKLMEMKSEHWYVHTTAENISAINSCDECPNRSVKSEKTCRCCKLFSCEYCTVTTEKRKENCQKCFRFKYK